MDLGLKGKKVIMNGGAHGLGLQSLKLFAAEGADVAFFSRKEDKIEAAKKQIDAAGPGKVHAEVHFAKLVNFLIATWLLVRKLIAWESKNYQTLFPKFLMKFL